MLSQLVMTGRRVASEWLNQPLFSCLSLVAVSLAAWRMRELNVVYFCPSVALDASSQLGKRSLITTGLMW